MLNMLSIYLPILHKTSLLNIVVQADEESSWRRMVKNWPTSPS